MSEGPECQQKFTETSPGKKIIELPAHNSVLKFFNQDGDEVGMLDFNGPGLSFEGVADLSAITFMDYLSKQFQARLKQEYDRGVADGRSSQKTK
jgi:hypothetical protein